MQFPDKYFENEIREGFFVPSMVKRAWAAELEVLSEIDKICQKYNIQYFAEWGTLLGAVRHNGFIPWDDDLDIGMKRADYERFLAAAEKELPTGYKINNCRTRDDFWLFLARVMNTGHMCFEDEHLKNFHEFPYIAGVDIFVMDYVSRDEEKEKERDTLADYVIVLADYIGERRITAEEALEGLKKIESIGHRKLEYNPEYLKKWLNGAGTELGEYIAKFHQRMYAYAESLFAVFSEEEADELTQLFPFGLRRKDYRYPKEYYEDCIRIPFENTTIPVPIGYDAMLKRRYGDYMQIRKVWSGHTYPFFESQQAELDALLDVKLPSYQYTENEAALSVGNRDKHIGENTFKEYVINVYEELKNYSSPEESQTLAIELGTAIEHIYGEGHPTVALLEAYCEQMYMLACTGVEEAGLKVLLSELGNSIRDCILDKKETIFIVSKVSEWNYIRHTYEKAKEDEDCEVYVVVVPYFYKRYDGTLYNMQDEYENFEKLLGGMLNNVHVLRYDEYDIMLHHPETVYIQNPYDEWDAGLSIHPDYYTDKLKENCDRLVYIPPFAVEEFNKDNYCEYHNLAKYALVPGVVRADRVLVQSENMKLTYVDKLTEWAGEETRHIWESKISGAGTQLEDCHISETTKQEAIDSMPDEWKQVIYRADGSLKKIVLYHVEASFFIQNKENAFEKISSAFTIFNENKDNVALIWNVGNDVGRIIERNLPELVTGFRDIENMASKIGICDISDGRRVAAICEAYYGDGCYLSRLCQIDGKPIMIENVEIM